MRQSQKNNRARGKNNRKSSGANVNRVYESSGPEGKVRGTPQQIIEKYQSLARDKMTSGDRVVAENFLQHAEHYARILTAAQTAAAQSRREEEEEAEMARNEAEAANPPEQGEAQQGPQEQDDQPRKRPRRPRRPRDSENAAEAGETPSSLLVIDAVSNEPSEPRAQEDNSWSAGERPTAAE